ncbi:hypothetical protein MFMK1_002032 [Metallumcola ferriviriculae]|uniref:Peptidase S7 n=1 Tax=Metallumcola ferriviriculae TaxID=3039180 RepID=A0AAU0UPT3_9FIRM|nr:hypothetical protein MFMK1_002032 [Desulfitibacteraceae bacterium MK1]
MEIKAVSQEIVDMLVQRTTELSQGRNAGCLGFIDDTGFVSSSTKVIDGGLNGIPLRIMLSHITNMEGKSLIEGMSSVPDNAVLIMTRPGKTGLITDVSGVDFFNLPIISIGVKNNGLAGIGLIMPKEEYFDLATESEMLNLATLGSVTMDDEKEVLKKSNLLSLKYLELTTELGVSNKNGSDEYTSQHEHTIDIPRIKINAIDKGLARDLVDRSMEVGQGREVAMMGRIEDGRVVSQGQIVEGGIGFVPSRLLASSAVDISQKSLRKIYSELVPEDAVIVHTHPGGTGVMHIGDANAGPGTWGRAIVAIGHDAKGKIRGATVVESGDKLYQLADEDEQLGLQFFQAETPEREAEIRNRKFGIAQEYTGLCKPIQIN